MGGTPRLCSDARYIKKLTDLTDTFFRACDYCNGQYLVSMLVWGPKPISRLPHAAVTGFHCPEFRGSHRNCLHPGLSMSLLSRRHHICSLLVRNQASKHVVTVDAKCLITAKTRASNDWPCSSRAWCLLVFDTCWKCRFYRTAGSLAFTNLTGRPYPHLFRFGVSRLGLGFSQLP